MYQNFIQKLTEELENPLPGSDAQKHMAPMPGSNDRFNFKKSNEAKLGGVMILLYPDNGKIMFPLTERAKYPGVHSGQISFPGGKYELEDEDLVQTAKRETFEEIGVDMDAIQVIGKLSELYIPPSNFHVYPCIAYLEEKPKFKEETFEVVKIIETDITTLLDDDIAKRNEIQVNEKLRMNVPYFDIYDHIVWGATAMMLNEFKTIIKKII